MSFFGNLNAEDYDRQYSDRDLIRRIGSYMRRERGLFVRTGVVIALTAVAQAILPILAGEVVEIIERGEEIPLTEYSLYFLGLGVGIWCLNYLRTIWFAKAGANIVLNMRNDAFEAALERDMSFYDSFSSGRIISRITSDTQEFGNVLRLVGDILNQIAVIVILLAVLLRISPLLTVILFVMCPVIVVVAQQWRKAARRITGRGFRAIGNVNAAIQEAVTGISVAKNFRQEATLYDEFDNVNSDSYAVNIKRGTLFATIFPVLSTLSATAFAAFIWFGGLAVGAGSITAGAWFLFLNTVDRFFFPMIQISSFWSQFQGGLSASERIFALIDAEPTVKQTASDHPPRLKGHIEFEAVDFRYTEQERILDQFSLDIKPGESIALVGHTGAGKSSLAKLISRFYEFQGGILRVDGADIRSFDLQAYRQQLGIVSQVPFLFSGSVADNIRYGSPNASDAEIERVAHQIGNGEWLETLPNGLNSDVGERGGRLSMGQRQLVALTRVLVQNPAIFILDEATASIDPFTETQIQEALDLVLKGRTSILIAHRLSTVRSADRIIVLSQGDIIEQGSHKQLIEQGGHYAELYNTYFRHQSLDYKPWEDATAA